MSLLAKAVAFNIGTGAAASTVTVTGVGFTPIACLLFASRRTEAVDTFGPVGDQRRIAGFAANCAGTIKNRGVGSYDKHAGVAAFIAKSHNRNDSCLIRSSAGGANEGRASVTAFNSDGCVLTIGTQFVADMRVIAIFYGGSDITDAQIGTYTEPAAGAPPFTDDVTGLGFNPADGRSICFWLAQSATTENAAHGDSDIQLGAFTSAAQQVAWSGGQNDAHPTTSWCQRHLKSGQIVCNFAAATSQVIDRRATFASWIADGFRFTWDEITANANLGYYLVLNGGRWAVLTGTTATGLSDVVLAATGVGPPAGGIVLSHCTTESGADTQQTDDDLSIGVFDSPSSRYALGLANKNGLGTSACSAGIHHAACYLNMDETSTVLGLMDVKTIDTDGVTFTMDDADPAGSFFAAILAGSQARPPLDVPFLGIGGFP